MKFLSLIYEKSVVDYIHTPTLEVIAVTILWCLFLLHIASAVVCMNMWFEYVEEYVPMFHIVAILCVHCM